MFALVNIYQPLLASDNQSWFRNGWNIAGMVVGAYAAKTWWRWPTINRHQDFHIAENRQTETILLSLKKQVDAKKTLPENYTESIEKLRSFCPPMKRGFRRAANIYNKQAIEFQGGKENTNKFNKFDKQHKNFQEDLTFGLKKVKGDTAARHLMKYSALGASIFATAAAVGCFYKGYQR